MVKMRVLSRRHKPRPVRTLGDVLALLPYRKLGKNPALTLDPLPNDVLPELEPPNDMDEIPQSPGLPDRVRVRGDNATPKRD